MDHDKTVTASQIRKSSNLRLPSKFETFSQAEDARMQLSKRLRRSSEEGVAELAEYLSECTVGARCNSAACPSCLRLFRKRWLSQSHKALQGSAKVYRVNLVPRGGRVAPGALRRFNFKNFVKREQRAIQRALARRRWVILGGVDVSMNTFNNVPLNWQVHLYFAIGVPGGVEAEDVRKAFAPRRDPDASAHPLYVKEVAAGRLADVLTYAVKATFLRRSQYTYSRKGGSSTTNTRQQPLTAAQSVELAMALDATAIGDRLLLVGVRRTWPDGRLRLTRTHRYGRR